LSELVVGPGRKARWRGRELSCAIGRGGIVAEKREGDGATPAGRFLLRRLLYRADRVGRPATALPAAPIGPRDGWCDDPADPLYNRPVQLPYPGRHEALWRQDGLYDLLVVLGHNDDPVRPGLGSAVFLHVAAPDWTPTEGCVALARDELLRLLGESGPGDAVAVRTS
jgi:L,D-peptidoglycan transpeptidase YkuD (ErfK/YbiS/YcfS/YnhG family)